jgi:hypothetical protein
MRADRSSGSLQRDDIPATILIAEAGKLTPAQSSPWLSQIGFEKLVGDDPRRNGLAGRHRSKTSKAASVSSSLFHFHIF